MPATPHCRRPPPRRSEYALCEGAARTRQAINDDEIVGGALASVSWKRIARLPASSSRQRLLLHKLKGLRLSGWDRAAGRRGCPHCQAEDRTDDTGHAFHIMWRCPSAQLLWNDLRTMWSQLGVHFASDDGYCNAVFSLSVSQTPPIALCLLGHRGVPTDLVVVVHDVVNILWQQQVLGCLQTIWRCCHGTGDAGAGWTETIAKLALRNSCRAAHHQAAGTLGTHGEHSQALRSLLIGLQDLQVLPERPARRVPISATDTYLLFFDGGSRRNPGAGGSGAIIVRVDAVGGSPSIEWAAAMSLANDTTTNNQAEYFASPPRKGSRRERSSVTVP